MIVDDYGEIEFFEIGQREINNLPGRQYGVFFDLLSFSPINAEVDIMLLIITSMKPTKELEKEVSF